MRRLAYTEPGQLAWQEVPEPELQGSTEALVRPVAVARCDIDYPIVRGRTPFQPPIAVGHEFVAEIVQVGSDVSGLERGQRVIVPFQISCGECDRCRQGLTNSCQAVPPGSMYGFGEAGGEWGGALADLVRVPFAEGMLVPLPGAVKTASIVSADNLPDGWRTVAPQLREAPGSPVLIIAGGAPSIGLYAAAVAGAMGASRVDYVDNDSTRLALAESLGANPIVNPPSDQLGSYPITVDASSDPKGLASALGALEPGGVCTSIGIYFTETTMPLREMYAIGVRFQTGSVNARACLPEVLDLIEEGSLQPERINSMVVGWEDAAEAWTEHSTKLVVLRATTDTR